MSELEIIEIKIKGIIDIVNKLNDIDTIVSLDKIKESNGLYFVNIDVDCEGILYNHEFTIKDEIFNKAYDYIMSFIDYIKEVIKSDFKINCNNTRIYET